jgi:hypothetical protein
MSAKVTTVPGQSLLAVDGVPTYLHGANYAWNNYAEFGEVATWQNPGANRVFNHQPKIETDFQQLAGQGLTAVRWFLFTDGRNGIQFDPTTKLPTGLTPGVLEDMDTALAIARTHGIRVIFSVLDFMVMRKDSTQGTRAHPEILTASGQQAFLQNVLGPVLAHYAHEDSILAWEVMNEPEWVISEFLNSTAQFVTLPFQNFAEFTKSFANAVHQSTDALVTVGGADPRYISEWDKIDLGLDFCQVHCYYNPQIHDPGQDLYGKTAASYRVQHPLLIGEVPGKNDPHIPSIDLGSWLNFAFGNGYAGLWPWALTVDGGPYTPYDSASMLTFARQHPEVSNPAALQ